MIVSYATLGSHVGKLGCSLRNLTALRAGYGYGIMCDLNKVLKVYLDLSIGSWPLIPSRCSFETSRRNSKLWCLENSSSYCFGQKDLCTQIAVYLMTPFQELDYFFF